MKDSSASLLQGAIFGGTEPNHPNIYNKEDAADAMKLSETTHQPRSRPYFEVNMAEAIENSSVFAASRSQSQVVHNAATALMSSAVRPNRCLYPPVTSTPFLRHV